MSLLISWLLNALALVITAYLPTGIHVANYSTALFAAIIIGLLNVFIRPILLLLTAPLNLLTLGLFTFVVNAIVLWVAALLIPGLTIDNFWSAIIAAIVLSFVSTILSHLLKDLKKV